MIPIHFSRIFKPPKSIFLVSAINDRKYLSIQPNNSRMIHVTASTNIPTLNKDSVCTKKWFYTTAKKIEQEFTWIIEDFNFHMANIYDDELKSPVLSEVNDSYKWFLKLNIPLQYYSLKHESLHLNFEMVPCAFNISPISGSISASLMDSKNQKFNTCAHNFYEKSLKKCDKVSLRLIKCGDLKNELLPEGQLRIHINIAFIGDTITASNHFPADESNLTHDFEKLFNDEDSSDVIIEIDGKKYPAHKSVLAARSSVFHDMFKNDTMKSQRNRIEIKDTDEKNFQEVLRYIYTGKVENLNDIVFELIPVAEKYNLAPLKTACLHALSALLSEKTAVKILIMAELNGAQSLKTQAIEYILENWTNVTKSEDWNDLDCYPDLMKCLTSNENDYYDKYDRC
ncbi:speckle-type POZ protein B-like isoform X2 [Planococcus citri]|uniref:speckle-type POZ protein B-like isoform X2 n=1 Tax=Planococcus citri TaxID=170843 RepID=UPI0031F8CED5